MAIAEQMLAALTFSMTQMADAVKVLAEQQPKGTPASKLLDVRHRHLPQLGGAVTASSFDDLAFTFKRFFGPRTAPPTRSRAETRPMSEAKLHGTTLTSSARTWMS
jgi:hypothetical protein